MSQKILLISNLPEFAKDRERLLASHGFEVVSVLQADKAVTLLGAEAFAVVVIGPSISTADRQFYTDYIKSLSPHTLIVALHRGSIDNVEHADAVINATDPEGIITAIRYLLAESRETGRANAS